MATWQPFPVPSGFVLSYVQGYADRQKILNPQEHSSAWCCQWADICRMSNVLKAPDVDLVWSNFS
jgi:hypothetical protein